MQLQFLGTSSGTPTKQRNVSGIVIKQKNAKGWCLVDCGEATQHQLLHTSLSLNTLNIICITHVHGDHCYGLPGLLASAAMNGRKDAITIIAPKAIQTFLQGIIETTELHLSYALEFVDTAELTSNSFETNDFHIQSVQLSHRVQCFGYVFTEKPASPKLDTEKLKANNIPAGKLWGQLQKGEDVTLDGKTILSADYRLPAQHPRQIIVSGDNDTPSLYAPFASTADVLVHEATYTQDIAKKVGDGPMHSDALRVATFAEKAGIKNVVLTHFSPRYQADISKSPSIDDIKTEATQHYAGNLLLANDFDVFVLDKDGGLSLI